MNCNELTVFFPESSISADESSRPDWCFHASDNFEHGAHVSQGGAAETLQRVLVHPSALHTVPGPVDHSPFEVSNILFY